MNRIIIVTNAMYPKGNALANYIEKICKLLKLVDSDYDITIIAAQNSHDLSVQETVYDTKIIYVCKNKYNPFYLDFFELERTLHELSKNLNKGDVFFVFGLGIINCLQVFIFSKKSKAYSVVCYGERYDRKYFDKNIIGLLGYLHSEIRLNIIMPIAKNAIVVSNHLKEKCINDRMNVALIPPLSDELSFYCNEDYEKKKYKWIYSGCDIRKDRIDNILMAFSNLDDNLIDSVELHFTGITSDKLKKLIDKKAWNKIKKNIYIHEWLNYKEYDALLRKMDFGIILRDVNRTTLANFPSKVPEYLNYGIIPVVSRVGDYTSFYLRDGIDSLFVEGSDPIQCVKVIKRAMALTEKDLIRLKNNARRTCAEKFYINNWKETMETFMKKLKR